MTERRADALVGVLDPRTRDMPGWRHAARVLAAVLGLAGCGSANSTGPTDVDPALVGPVWRLTRIGGGPVLGETTVTASFSSDERVSGSAGCNSYSGRARAEAGRISVGPLASTLMACQGDGVMEQEARYLAFLAGATQYSIRGDDLRLGPSASEITLSFTSR